MKHLLPLKARQCTDYRQHYYIQSQASAAAITDKFWDTGITAQTTTRTKPEYWPGINMLGKIMADTRDKLVSQRALQKKLPNSAPHARSSAGRPSWYAGLEIPSLPRFQPYWSRGSVPVGWRCIFDSWLPQEKLKVTADVCFSRWQRNNFESCADVQVIPCTCHWCSRLLPIKCL